MPPARAAMQDWTCLVLVLTVELWEMLDSTASQLVKLDALVEHLVRLGLRTPSELTCAALACLLSMHDQHGEAVRRDAAQSLALLHTCKTRLKAAVSRAKSSGTAVPVEVRVLPADPSALPDAFMQGMVFVPPRVQLQAYMNSTRGWPLRQSNTLVRQNSRVGDPQNILMQAAELFKALRGSPASAQGEARVQLLRPQPSKLMLTQGEDAGLGNLAAGRGASGSLASLSSGRASKGETRGYGELALLNSRSLPAAGPAQSLELAREGSQVFAGAKTGESRATAPADASLFSEATGAKRETLQHKGPSPDVQPEIKPENGAETAAKVEEVKAQPQSDAVSHMPSQLRSMVQRFAKSHYDQPLSPWALFRGESKTSAKKKPAAKRRPECQTPALNVKMETPRAKIRRCLSMDSVALVSPVMKASTAAKTLAKKGRPAAKLDCVRASPSTSRNKSSKSSPTKTATPARKRPAQASARKSQTKEATPARKRPAQASACRSPKKRPACADAGLKTTLKCIKSRAYHRAFKQAQLRGETDKECYAAARTAHREAKKD